MNLVISCVIYLRQDDTITEESPLTWTLPSGKSILTFHYVTIKLWERTAEELLQSGLVGLYPLMPLTEDGKQMETVDQMIEGIATAEQWNLLPLSQIIACLVFKDDIEYEQLQRRFIVGNHILEESRLYQDILRKGMDKGVRRGVRQEAVRARKRELDRNGQLLLKIVQGRFPDLLNQASQYIKGVQDPEQLQQMVIKVSLAQDTQQARCALAEAEGTRA